MKIGFTEILVILGVALLVLGPDKMPYYAKKLGEALKEFKKVSSEATKDIRESVIEPLEEAQRPLKEAMEPITELEKDIRGGVEDIKKSFNDLGKPETKEQGTSEEDPAAAEKAGIQKTPEAKEEEAPLLEGAKKDPAASEETEETESV